MTKMPVVMQCMLFCCSCSLHQNFNYEHFQVDMLNAEKTALTQGLQAPSDKALMLTQEKKMALCEICGSFLVANDAAERTQSHVTGKQHIGYGMVRDFISEFKVNDNSSFHL